MAGREHGLVSVEFGGHVFGPYVVRLVLSKKVASTSVDWDQGDITFLHAFEGRCVDTAASVWLLGRRGLGVV